MCKACKADAERLYRSRHKDEIRERKRAEYLRNGEKRKPQRHEYYLANREAVIRAIAQWRARNPEKVQRTLHEYYLAHRQELIERAAKWQRENPERVREKNSRWRQNNLEKARAIAREGGHRRYWDNPSKSRAEGRLNRARRVARECGLPHTFAETDWAFVLAAFGYSCAYCGVPWSWAGGLDQDHVVPVTKGGGYVMGNIVPACRSCNASKGNKDCCGWMGKRGFDFAFLEQRLTGCLA